LGKPRGNLPNASTTDIELVPEYRLLSVESYALPLKYDLIWSLRQGRQCWDPIAPRVHRYSEDWNQGETPAQISNHADRLSARLRLLAGRKVALFSHGHFSRVLAAPVDRSLRVGGLTGALLDRLTHHVHILEMNGNSFRLKNSRKKKDPDGQ
jgi:hypothetical protein